MSASIINMACVAESARGVIKGGALFADHFAFTVVTSLGCLALARNALRLLRLVTLSRRGFARPLVFANKQVAGALYSGKHRGVVIAFLTHGSSVGAFWIAGGRYNLTFRSLCVDTTQMVANNRSGFCSRVCIELSYSLS